MKAKRSARLYMIAMLMLSLAVLTSCAKRTVYIEGSSRTLPVKGGEVCPDDGWLLSDAALVDLLECCGREVTP